MSNSSLTKLSWLAALAAIWLPVIYLLGAQWSLFVEYQYGWAVPFLCLYLVAQRFSSLPSVTGPQWKGLGAGLLVAAAILFWAMRVLQEANPVWRLASYGLALAAVVMTLLVIYLAQGSGRAAHFFFPAAFFIAAVPWPTPVESAFIQTLTRVNAGLATEVLNLTGVPALLHGNVIEISAGMVGIDEACSGIRSFQATLMVALFFGAFYQLGDGRRGWLLGAGPALALAFNFGRTLILVFVAARAGLPAMERWHDTTGMALLVSCFLSLWGVAAWMARTEHKVKNRILKSESQKRQAEARDAGDETSAGGDPKAEASSQGWAIRVSRPVKSPWLASPGGISIIALAGWGVLWAATVEVSTEAWFRSHEARDRQASRWMVQWPEGNPTLHTNIISPNSLRILRCDQNSSASWVGEDGEVWQAFFLRWLPSDSFYGRAKVALSKFHNPTDCLPASGITLQDQLASVSVPVRPGLNRVFDRYVFDADGRKLFVFFSETEDTISAGQNTLPMTHLARLRAALAGSRNYGQNSFEFALIGPDTADAALRLFSTQLPELIKMDQRTSP